MHVQLPWSFLDLIFVGSFCFFLKLEPVFLFFVYVPAPLSRFFFCVTSMACDALDTMYISQKLALRFIDFQLEMHIL